MEEIGASLVGPCVPEYIPAAGHGPAGRQEIFEQT
jgi:hypothetical protein